VPVLSGNSTKQRASRPGALGRWKIALAVAASLVVAAASAAGFYLNWRRQRLTEKDTIVVADFLNSTGDSVFDETLKQGLRAQLEQSPFLNILSDHQVREELQLMARPPGERLTPESARELCQRVGSKAVLIGSISPLGSRYVIGLRPNDHLLYTYFGISLQGERPSLVFVIGVPLGDNKSPEWIMMVNHYGPTPAYNCQVHFHDKDRKNIEHEWLVKHPQTPFPPPGLAGQSQLHLHIPEADPPGLATSFRWTPLDPDRQHYSVSINCRDGIFEENWEVTRVNGILRTRISVEHGPHWKEKNPNSDPVVFACSDPEFVPTPLALEIPTQKLQAIHPGWKPNHKFELPVAIIEDAPRLVET
jgi:hypothetical protein